jgi:hypothetical protein
MTDYEQMTDTELQTEIAKRLGWTEIVFSRPYLVGREPGDIRPDENRYIIPKWPQDANDALELLNKFMTLSITLEWNSILEKWSCRILLAHRLLPIDAKNTTLARAISIAWLRWKDTE